MTLLANFSSFNQQHQLISKETVTLCGVSGGADSMALAHLLHKEGFPIHVAHFHHHIRGQEADRDAQMVETWCKRQKIPFTLGHGNVPEEAEKQGKSLEEMARIMRYQFLENTANSMGFDLIATAHHGDDNVETLLHNLIRGTGLQGLTGIPPRRGMIVRPLLSSSRSQILDYLEANQVEFLEDSTNSDCTHTRNHLRHKVLPLLKELNPNLVNQVFETTCHLRSDSQFLLDQTQSFMAQVTLDEESATFNANALSQLPESLAIRGIGQCFQHVGLSQFGRQHLRSVLDLSLSDCPSAQVDLPLNLQSFRRYDHLIIGKKKTKLTCEKVNLVLDGNTTFGAGWQFSCQPCICPDQHREERSFYLAKEQIKGQLLLRSREVGDSISLPSRSTKTIKKLLIEHKIPENLRDSLPIIADEHQVFYLGGFGVHGPALAKPGEACHKITLLASPKSEI